MAQKFFATIFGRRKPVISERKSQVSDFKTIKPAKDIGDFEYPLFPAFTPKSLFQMTSRNRYVNKM